MVDLPFDAICIKGAVFLWRDYRFSDGEEKDKFVIILSKDNSLDPVLLILTTSQIENYKRIKRLHIETYTIRTGEYTWFPKETLLDFSKIIGHNKEELSSAYGVGKLKYCGALKDSHLKEIDDIVYKSEIIEEYKIERIV
ncbi:MAG: hypothetical protein AABY50_04205 [Nitrospirota bacterium]